MSTVLIWINFKFKQTKIKSARKIPKKITKILWNSRKFSASKFSFKNWRKRFFKINWKNFIFQKFPKKCQKKFGNFQNISASKKPLKSGANHFSNQFQKIIYLHKKFRKIPKNSKFSKTKISGRRIFYGFWGPLCPLWFVGSTVRKPAEHNLKKKNPNGISVEISKQKRHNNNKTGNKSFCFLGK